MKTFKIVTRFDAYSNVLKEKLEKRLMMEGYIYQEENPTYVFVIGGDGTFLKAVHSSLNHLKTTYFSGIHTGTLGFFTDYTADEIELFIEDFLNQKPRISHYQLLEITVDKKDIFYAVNEMRIENSLKTQVLTVNINDQLLETFRGTGMCVCTQMGSTAYNRSLRGAILEEGLPLIQLSEIAGINNSVYHSISVPIVLRESSTITFQANDFRGAILCYDAYHYDLSQAKEVSVKLCDKQINMLRYKEVSFVKRLQGLF